MTASSGPLKGTTANGTFSYDSSSIVPGGSNSATGLLTALSVTWDAIAYTQATANTGFLTFNGAGTLTGGCFGNNSGVGFCSVGSGQEQWAFGINTVVPSSMAYAKPGSLGFFTGTG